MKEKITGSNEEIKNIELPNMSKCLNGCKNKLDKIDNELGVKVFKITTAIISKTDKSKN